MNLSSKSNVEQRNEFIGKFESGQRSNLLSIHDALATRAGRLNEAFMIWRSRRSHKSCKEALRGLRGGDRIC